MILNREEFLSVLLRKRTREGTFTADCLSWGRVDPDQQTVRPNPESFIEKGWLRPSVSQHHVGGVTYRFIVRSQSG